MNLSELNSINIFVNDMNKTVKFYKLLGFEFPEEKENKTYLKGKIKGLTLSFYAKEVFIEFFSYKTDVNASGYPFSIAIRISTINQFDNIFKKIEEKGYRAFKPIEDTSWGQRTVFFLDPDKNLIEINAIL
ncbi:MAG: hypothetical protein HeimC3_38250 [Candidatus Heimdallarchaeota archaeon LC_3]|nr:MAG: hypothetical protein HeimC3_38250 [Candidatus Heimdallarchaeota archaeon LC_3]